MKQNSRKSQGLYGSANFTAFRTESANCSIIICHGPPDVGAMTMSVRLLQRHRVSMVTSCVMR